MNKDKAIHFLELIIAGNIDEAYDTYINFDGKHHNVYTPAGFNHLKEGMQSSENATPNKQFEIKNVFDGGEVVAVHSHLVLNSDEPGMSVVHMFRFENEKIIEMWDVAQSIPQDSPNNDGPF